MYSTLEAQLYEAIERGDVKLVSQFMSSGLSVNTILFNLKTNKFMTILSCSAYENKVNVVQYLINVLRAPVNYQDSLFQRSALHWACIGNSLDCADLLIKANSNVNACDRDNATPIIFATMSGSLALTCLLVDNGAQVTALDRLHSSALHYATFYGKNEIIRSLIKAGCLSNEVTVFGQGTPLANLTYRSDFENIHLLVEAGYDLSHDSWIPGYEKHEGIAVVSPDIGSYLKHEHSNPPSLRCLCRISFIKQFKGIFVEKKLQQLSMPRVIKDYLLLKSV